MGRLTFTSFVCGQLQKVPPLVTADLTGKVVLIIGANTGLGLEASKHIARMNPARLILGCRSPPKGQAAVEEVKNETGYQSVEFWEIDLSRFSSVEEFAEKFEKDGGRLDLLIQNAGAAPVVFNETPDGWESTLQVNYLSHSLLAILLLPRMIQTSKEHSTTPRLVVVTSEVHFWATLQPGILEEPKILHTLSSKEHCTPSVMATRYQDTKLFNVFFVRALTDRLSKSSPHAPIVNAINPGFCHSELLRDLTGTYAAIVWLTKTFLAHTTEEGSRQLVWGAVGGAGEEDALRGAYISSSQVSEPSDFVLSEDGKKAQDSIWDDMVETLGQINPRVLEIVSQYLD